MEAETELKRALRGAALYSSLAAASQTYAALDGYLRITPVNFAQSSVKLLHGNGEPPSASTAPMHKKFEEAALRFVVDNLPLVVEVALKNALRELHEARRAIEIFNSEALPS